MRNSSKFLLVTLVMFNLCFISCSDDSLADIEELENIYATEGDDGEVIEEPDDD